MLSADDACFRVCTMYEGHEDPTHKEAGYIQLRVNQPAGEGPHFQLQEARTSLRTKAAAYVCLGLGLDLGVWMELGHGDWAGSAVGCGLARLWKNRSGGEEKSRLPLCCRRAGRDLGHLNQLSWRLSRWHLWATAACSNLQLADRRDTCLCPSRYALANATKTAAATRRELAIH